MARSKKGAKGPGSEFWSKRTPAKAKGGTGKFAKKLTNRAERISAKEEEKSSLQLDPIVHYVDEQFVDYSPCGNNDNEAILSDRLDKVTCTACLKYKARIN